jgi:hypothetical protein
MNLLLAQACLYRLFLGVNKSSIHHGGGNNFMSLCGGVSILGEVQPVAYFFGLSLKGAQSIHIWYVQFITVRLDALGTSSSTVPRISSES